MPNVITYPMRLAGLATLALLAVPLALTLANPASHLRGGGGGGFDWGPGDFLVMGAMLFAAALAIQLAARHLTRPATRGLALLAILALFALVWAELAVDGVSKALALLAHDESCSTLFVDPTLTAIRFAIAR